MSKRRYLDLDGFLELFEKFISENTWTKNKHQKLENLENYLKKYQHTSISVGMEKGNYCVSKKGDNDDWRNYTLISNVITILKVPINKLGKLYGYRDKWVLIRGVSVPGYNGGGFNSYYNHVYLLPENFDENIIPNLKQRLGKYFVIQPFTNE